MAGARTGLPLMAGIMSGVCLSLLLFAPNDLPLLKCPPQPVKEFQDVSEHWVVHQDPMTKQSANQDSTPKVVRARFAATELGTRERLAVIILATESSMAVALNSSVSRHVPRVQLFADASRIDADMAQLSNLSPFKANGQRMHNFVLSLITNLTLHDNYDWFLIVKDSTAVNPFELNRFVNSVNWNEPVLIGSPSMDDSGRCQLDMGVLVSYPAMNKLIKNRGLCASQDESNADSEAFEQCLFSATGLACQAVYQGQEYRTWRADGGRAAHDAIPQWSQVRGFNDSLTVAKLLSEADATSLHDHFVRVEMTRLDAEILSMEAEVAALQHDVAGPTWPAAVPPYSRPPNRYQVPTWEMFTMKDLFKSEPNQNVRPLEGKDLDDVQEVVSAARSYVENEDAELEFEYMRNGYRLFDPMRGMDYIVDLVYKRHDGLDPVERRVHLSRMIASTELVNQVPYVKEDTDVIIVIAVEDEVEVLPARRLLARHARLCVSPTEETRKTRVVLVLSPSVDTRSATYIGNDLEELKKRCRRSALETDVIRIRDSEEVKPDGCPASRALDEAIDRYGANTIFLLLSPYSDYQKEFLDRARINTIKHYQVFFPVPFVEYHPTISGNDIEDHEVPTNTKEARQAALSRLREATPPKRKKTLIVQKDHGRFDSLDFSCLALYGSDYVAMRPKLKGKRLDLVSMFLQQADIHILRAVEPTLRIRYHQRVCDSEMEEEDYERCAFSKRENVASKDQMAKLLFHD